MWLHRNYMITKPKIIIFFGFFSNGAALKCARWFQALRDVLCINLKNVGFRLWCNCFVFTLANALFFRNSECCVVVTFLRGSQQVANYSMYRFFWEAFWMKNFPPFFFLSVVTFCCECDTVTWKIVEFEHFEFSRLFLTCCYILLWQCYQHWKIVEFELRFEVCIRWVCQMFLCHDIVVELK